MVKEKWCNYRYIPGHPSLQSDTIYNFFSYMTTFLEVQYGMSAPAHLQQSGGAASRTCTCRRTASRAQASPAGRARARSR